MSNGMLSFVILCGFVVLILHWRSTDSRRRMLGIFMLKGELRTWTVVFDEMLMKQQIRGAPTGELRIFNIRRISMGKWESRPIYEFWTELLEKTERRFETALKGDNKQEKKMAARDLDEVRQWYQWVPMEETLESQLENAYLLYLNGRGDRVLSSK